METQSVRIRLMFEDRLVSQKQRSEWMNHSWILIEPNQHPKISDVCNNLLHKFNLRSSCPNGILLFMEGFMLPPSELTRILKDNDIVCVRRNGIALAEAIEGAGACNLLDEEVNRRELVGNGMLLLENDEFDKETGGHQSESEDAVVVKVEEEPSPKETTSKKRKASTKLQSSKKKEHPSPVMDGVEDELAKDENIISKKTIKPTMEVKKENAETSDKNIQDNVEGVKQTSTAPDGAKKVPSRNARRKKAKRKWRQELAKLLQNVLSRSSRRKKAKRRWMQELAKHSQNPKTHEYTNEVDQANNNESFPQKKISKKKIKPNKEIKKEDAETSDKNIKDNVGVVGQTSTAPDGAKKVPSRRSRRKKAKRRWRRELAKISHNPDANEYANEIDQANNDESYPRKKISKKKIKPKNEEIKKENAETSDKNIKDKVEGVEQTSTAPDGAKKVPSRNSRRKKAKRRWRRELAKISHNPDNHVVPEVPNTEIKGANDHLEGPFKLPAKILHKNIIKQEEIYFNGDEDEDEKQIKLPDVAFQWNGITNKKTGQKWGLEKFPAFERDDSQKTTKESSTMLTEDTRIPLTDLIDFDQLPFCNSPKEGDVIAYRVLELSSCWTPELSSFRVGKVSYYDANNIVLMPVPEYPIISDKMDEDGPDNSLYKEDGSLEIKFAALADVRCVKQSNSNAVKGVSNGVNQTAQGDEKNAASNLMFNSNDDKAYLSKDPSPVVDNKEGSFPDEIDELLIAKKSELLEGNQQMKKDSGWNKWSYRALRGSALGPTMALLRSNNNI